MAQKPRLKQVPYHKKSATARPLRLPARFGFQSGGVDLDQRLFPHRRITGIVEGHHKLEINEINDERWGSGESEFRSPA